MDTKINLCDTCKRNVPTCFTEMEIKDTTFGDGLGNDNVIACKLYKTNLIKESEVNNE
jgi:hypothetical protein